MSAKTREAVSQTTSYQDALPTAKRNSEVENLILHLIEPLNGWDTDKKRRVQTTQDKGDLMAIFATTINSANASDHDQFVFAL